MSIEKQPISMVEVQLSGFIETLRPSITEIDNQTKKLVSNWILVIPGMDKLLYYLKSDRSGMIRPKS